MTKRMIQKAAYLVVLGWGISAGRPFLLPMCVAGLLAFLMAPAQRFLSARLRLPDGLAILFSALLLLSPLALVGTLLAVQGQDLVQDFPRLAQSAQAQLARIAALPALQRFGGSEGFSGGALLSKLSSGAGQGLGLIAGGLAALASLGTQSVLVFALALMMLGTRKHLRRSMERIVARHESLRSVHLVDQVVDLVQRFLIARIAVVGIVGALSSAALFAFQVNYSLFLGFFVGLMTLIPAIGFLIALVPALGVAIATGHSLLAVLGLTAALVAVNSLENYYLTPKMVGNRLNLNALTSFAGLFAGGLLWGLWGMVLSVPILGIMRIVFSAIPSMRAWGELLSDSDGGGKAGAATAAEPHQLREARGRKAG